jgi:hypothetical protein
MMGCTVLINAELKYGKQLLSAEDILAEFHFHAGTSANNSSQILLDKPLRRS